MYNLFRCRCENAAKGLANSSVPEKDTLISVLINKWHFWHSECLEQIQQNECLQINYHPPTPTSHLEM